MKIFLTGEPRVGKTTLIQKLVREFPDDYAGFWSEKHYDLEQGVDLVYIHATKGEWYYRPENCIGTCFPGVRAVGHKEVFEGYGRELLSHIPPKVPVIMDELGFLERDAEVFCKTALALLDSDNPVIGVIKPKPIAFLDQIRAHPAVQIFTVTRENTEEIYSQIAALWKVRGKG